MLDKEQASDEEIGFDCEHQTDQNGGFLKWGYSNSRMIYNGQSRLEMDDLRVAPILGNPQMNPEDELGFHIP